MFNQKYFFACYNDSFSYVQFMGNKIFIYMIKIFLIKYFSSNLGIELDIITRY